MIQKLINDRIQKSQPHGAMNYKYTLVIYHESRNAQDITFGVSEILTDNMYLC